MSQARSIDPPFTPDHNHMPVSDWVDHYGLVYALVPFQYRSYDPVAVTQSFRETFADKRITAARVPLSELREKAGLHPNALSQADPIVELAGSWRVSNNGQLSSFCANPHYVHHTVGDPITDADERRETLRRLAGYGTITQADVAARFGMEKTSSVESWCSRHDIPWSEWRREGVRRMARTAHVAQRWTDHSERDIADALGMARGTLRSWVHEHARTDDGFEVPPDPSDEPWFAATSVARRNRGGVR